MFLSSLCLGMCCDFGLDLGLAVDKGVGIRSLLSLLSLVLCLSSDELGDESPESVAAELLT